jgi:hypothetical protein
VPRAEWKARSAARRRETSEERRWRGVGAAAEIIKKVCMVRAQPFAGGGGESNNILPSFRDPPCLRLSFLFYAESNSFSLLVPVNYESGPFIQDRHMQRGFV